MRKERTADEKAAFALVRSALGVEIDPTGEQKAEGHVDAELIYEGRRAALEVSSLCDEEELRLHKKLEKGGDTLILVGSHHYWRVTVPPSTPLRELREVLKPALQLHEAYQVLIPDNRFPIEVRAALPQPLNWLREHKVVVWGFSDTTADDHLPSRHAGAVSIRVEGRGGAVGDANVIPRWL